MARATNKLTARSVAAAKEPGRYGDGGGLSLVVSGDGRRRWVFRYTRNAKTVDMGLGAAAEVTLAQAREAADAARKLLKAGGDPLTEKRKAPEAVVIIPTFKDAAVQVHAENLPAWKNGKHTAQWISTLEQHVFPKIGSKPVDTITTGDIRDALLPIWLTIPETARRVRQRIGAVLDWAHAKGYRPAEAPMRSVSKGLPRQPKDDGHFAAMPWQDLPAFLVQLRETSQTGPAVKLLLEFLILTAARSGEARGASWGEIDLEAREWCIPAARMKAGKAHTVPLSERALAVLTAAAKLREKDTDDALVFPGRGGKSMSDMTLTMILRRMKTGATAHGFRSTFRDWCAEATNTPREVAEAALAHTLENKVEAAYRRSDLLEKRRTLMETWAGFVTSGNAEDKVVPMARRRSRTAA